MFNGHRRAVAPCTYPEEACHPGHPAQPWNGRFVPFVPFQPGELLTHPLHASLRAAAPAEGGPRSYNDVMNGVMGTAEKRAGWRHYTSPVAEVKPLLASSISYTFPAQQVGGARVLPGQLSGQHCGGLVVLFIRQKVGALCLQANVSRVPTGHCRPLLIL